MRPRVLLAEDAPQIRELVSMILESRGFQVVPVVDGAQALLKIRDESFDLVITDQTMPFATGERVAAVARALRPGMPVVLLTGALEWAEPPETTGISAVLIKPFSAVKLIETIDRVLKGSSSD